MLPSNPESLYVDGVIPDCPFILIKRSSILLHVVTGEYGCLHVKSWTPRLISDNALHTKLGLPCEIRVRVLSRGNLHDSLFSQPLSLIQYAYCLHIKHLSLDHLM